MVNPGHPSRGCFACRRRKVKCDETYPQCNRCTRAGNTCPGYRNPNDLKFKIVAPGARPSKSPSPKQDPQRDRQLKKLIAEALHRPDFFVNETQALSLSRQSTRSGPRSDSSASSDSLVPRSPSTPWESLALPLFFNLFTAPNLTSLDSQGLMMFIPMLYSQAAPESCLHLALSAASDANAADKLTDKTVMVRARHKHVAALAALQRAIRDPISARDDATLCALLVLTLFEYITGDTNTPLGSHISGYEAMLDMRSKDIEDGSMNYSLFIDITSQIIINHFWAGTTPKPRTVEIVKNLTKDDPGTRVIKINFKVNLFNYEASKIITALAEQRAVDDDRAYERLWNIVHAGERLDEQISSWPGLNDDLVRETESFYTVCDDQVGDWVGPFHIYTSLWSAFRWNLHRAARILLLLVILRACRTLLELGHPADPVLPSLEKANATLNSLLADIVASFPYCLGRGDAKWSLPTVGIATSGFALMWPAGVVLRCPLSTVEHKVKCLAAIKYLGQALGVQRASNLLPVWARRASLEP